MDNGYSRFKQNYLLSTRTKISPPFLSSQVCDEVEFSLKLVRVHVKFDHNAQNSNVRGRQFPHANACLFRLLLVKEKMLGSSFNKFEVISFPFSQSISFFLQR